MDKIDVGNRIRQLREQKGWHKGTLATKAGISPSYIPKLENGEKSPTVETLNAICLAFDITLVQFFDSTNLDLPKDKVASLTDTQKHLLNQFLSSL